MQTQQPKHQAKSFAYLDVTPKLLRHAVEVYRGGCHHHLGGRRDVGSVQHAHELVHLSKRKHTPHGHVLAKRGWGGEARHALEFRPKHLIMLSGSGRDTTLCEKTKKQHTLRGGSRGGGRASFSLSTTLSTSPGEAKDYTLRGLRYP